MRPPHETAGPEPVRPPHETAEPVLPSSRGLEVAAADGSGVRAGRLLRLVGSTYESAVLRRPVGTLVLFEAPWCVACRALASALEELAASRATCTVVARIDAMRHRVAGPAVPTLPTLLLFRAGATQLSEAIRYDGDGGAADVGAFARRGCVLEAEVKDEV